jgi:hypothetical protein
MTKSERLLRLLLRTCGTADLLAVGAVVMPYFWMNAIHQWLGMGWLPDEPIVGYLARSTSAFYAMLGGLAWVASFDLYRHRLILCYLGAATIVFGLALLIIDILEGMPQYWVVCEGPVDTALGVLILVLSRRLKRQG